MQNIEQTQAILVCNLKRQKSHLVAIASTVVLSAVLSLFCLFFHGKHSLNGWHNTQVQFSVNGSVKVKYPVPIYLSSLGKQGDEKSRATCFEETHCYAKRAAEI